MMRMGESGWRSKEDEPLRTRQKSIQPLQVVIVNLDLHQLSTKEEKKTPEPQQNYFPKRRSPDLQSQRRGSPELNNYSRRKSKSPPTTSNNGKVNSHRGHRRYERRGSNSSQEGSDDMTSKTGNKPAPASNNVQLNHEDLMK